MSRLAVVSVVLMVALAGCSTGSDGGNETSPESTATTELTEEGTTPSDDTNGEPGSQPNLSTALSNLDGEDPFSDATSVEATLFNGSDQITILAQNDTDAERELIELSSSEGGTNSLYTTNDYRATRNTTTGETQYGQPDGNVGAGVGFGAAFGLFASLSYVGVVEWQEGGTTSVDGDTGYVYEADSLNETVFENQVIENLNLGFEQSEVQSVDGRMVIDEGGQIRSVNVEIETPDGTYGTELSVEYDDITIDKPDWVDESEAP